MATTVDTSAPTAASTPASTSAFPQLSHAEILKVMTGLLAGLFTAMLSTTIVSTALPTIMADLHGTQRQYTWVITSSLLAMTISTAIWGKLSDLFSKKLLVQLAIVLFVAGSVAAGLSQSVPVMMAFRAVQGVAMGGLIALTQSIMGVMIPPRQRGRYAGYMGAVMAVSTVSGPLLGGVITDNINWRWCFFVCVPLAVVALILLQLTLRPLGVKRRVKIDYLGAVLLAIAAALPMVWVTFAGSDYAWISWPTAAFLGGFVVASLLVVVVELRVSEPIVPIRVLRNRTTALMILASLGVGVSLFAGSTFLTQYFQLAGGHTPTRAGLMTIPLILSQMLSSTIGGQIVTRTGRWKPLMVVGSVMLVLGLFGMGRIDHSTPYWQVAVSMAVMGVGVGALIQNIVLAVQNTVDVSQIGASSATVTFFRSLGGAVGVAVLGAVLATHVENNVRSGLRAAGIRRAAGAGANLDIKDLPPQLQAIVHTAYGDSFGILFTSAAIVSIVTLVAVLLVREVPLRSTVELRPAAAQAAEQEQPAEPRQLEQPRESQAPVAPVAPVTPVAPATGWDDPAERLSVAALDVLTAAQDQVRQHTTASATAQHEVIDLLDSLEQQVAAVVGDFRERLHAVREELSSPDRGASLGKDGAGTDNLRSYEYSLLLNSQRTADKVTRLARLEAERTLAEAEGQVRELEQRIATLRAAEAELSGRVAAQLRQEA